MSLKKLTYEGWQDSVELVIMLWLCASPFVLGFIGNGAAAATALLIGATGLLIAQLGIARQQPWEEWTNITLSLILIISPWLFSYASNAIAATNAIICGSLVIVFAIASLKHEYHQIHLSHH